MDGAGTNKMHTKHMELIICDGLSLDSNVMLSGPKSPFFIATKTPEMDRKSKARRCYEGIMRQVVKTDKVRW